MPVGVPRFDAADDAVYGRFGGLGLFFYLFRRGKVKDRRPGIGHPDSIVRIDFAAAYGFAGHVSGCAGRCAIGGDKIQVTRLKRGLFQKLLDNSWASSRRWFDPGRHNGFPGCSLQWKAFPGRQPAQGGLQHTCNFRLQKRTRSFFTSLSFDGQNARLMWRDWLLYILSYRLGQNNPITEIRKKRPHNSEKLCGQRYEW